MSKLVQASRGVFTHVVVGTVRHKLVSTVAHSVTGITMQASVSTLAHSSFEDSFGSSVQALLTTVMQAFFGTSSHSCLSTGRQISFSSVLQLWVSISVTSLRATAIGTSMHTSAGTVWHSVTVVVVQDV